MPKSFDIVERVDENDLPALALGAAVLGTGGGGSVDAALASATAAIREHGPVRLLPLAELADDDLVIGMSVIGAPTVGQEMLPGAGQSRQIVEMVADLMGRPPTAILPIEIGGSNGVAPVAWAARSGLPLLDADAMGRAFPEGQMTSISVAGIEPGPVVLVDVLGNVSILRPIDAHWSERQARALCVASGASSMMADHSLTGRQARECLLPASVSRAIAIGRAVRTAGSPLDELREVLGAEVLLEGKVVDVDRRTSGGFVRGTVTISGTGVDKDRVLRIEIQNENLIALEDGAVLASVPDLITVVDSQTATAIFTETLAYGQRVTVLAWACDPVWRTERGLELAGPAAFGYDLPPTTIEGRAPALSTAGDEA